MENYFISKNKSDCNGCGACALRCPKSAIKMVEDEEGFLYPVIDESKCINCGLCKRICSNNPTKVNSEQVYITQNKDVDILNDSSSGGLFSIIADYVLENGGLVFGVKYDNDLKVVHSYTNNREDLKQFRHSKYVRSDLMNSYEEVENFLKNDLYVLFTGTPCQCAGLKSFLKKDYEKLITCDIICHANPSPKVFKMFKENVESKYDKKVSSFDFRNKKKYGWHSGSHMDVFFEDGTSADVPAFTNAFQNELINRPSCYNCRFCSSSRYSDFTIGDLWGLDKVQAVIKDDNSGYSLLSVNTDKGKYIFNIIKDKMMVEEIDKDLAWKHNHNSNIPYHKNRNKFFREIESKKINNSNVIFYLNKYSKRPFYRRVLGKIKRVIIKLIKR